MRAALFLNIIRYTSARRRVRRRVQCARVRTSAGRPSPSYSRMYNTHTNRFNYPLHPGHHHSIYRGAIHGYLRPYIIIYHFRFFSRFYIQSAGAATITGRYCKHCLEFSSSIIPIHFIILTRHTRYVLFDIYIL